MLGSNLKKGEVLVELTHKKTPNQRIVTAVSCDVMSGDLHSHLSLVRIDSVS